MPRHEVPSVKFRSDPVVSFAVTVGQARVIGGRVELFTYVIPVTLPARFGHGPPYSVVNSSLWFLGVNRLGAGGGYSGSG